MAAARGTQGAERRARAAGRGARSVRRAAWVVGRWAVRDAWPRARSPGRAARNAGAQVARHGAWGAGRRTRKWGVRWTRAMRAHDAGRGAWDAERGA